MAVLIIHGKVFNDVVDTLVTSCGPQECLGFWLFILKVFIRLLVHLKLSNRFYTTNYTSFSLLEYRFQTFW